MGYIEGKVSVVIPTYKRSDTLARAIISVKNQTYPNIEILVVDDNEPGDEYSREVAALVSSLGFDNLFLVTQDRHINGAAARNAGIRRADGEFISFLDDDDLWLPDKIDRQVSFIRTLDNSFGGVSTRKIFYLNGNPDHISETWKYTKNQNYRVLSKQLNIQTCTLLLRRTALDEMGYFDENLRRHQEVQLMSFFTQKYKVEFMDDLTTVIDCSDVSNRPSAQKLMEFKQNYFNSVKPVVARYGKHKQKLIVKHNMTEVAYAVYRDKSKGKGLMQLLGCLIYPSVTASFLKRFILKKQSRTAIRSADRDRIDAITAYVQRCEEQAQACAH